MMEFLAANFNLPTIIVAVMTEDGTLCLLLSDGMGCGEAAQRESSMAVRLLERFLRAGIDAPPALKTLNSALSLRAESTDSFTTVDLLTLRQRLSNTGGDKSSPCRRQRG